MEKLTGQQSRDKVTVHLGGPCQEPVQSETPARIEKHCPHLRGDDQTPKPGWPPFLGETKRVLSPKGQTVGTKYQNWRSSEGVLLFVFRLQGKLWKPKEVALVVASIKHCY